MGFLLITFLLMIFWFLFAAPTVQSTRCIRQRWQREIQALMVAVDSIWKRFLMNQRRFVHRWTSILLLNFNYYKVFYLLLLISIHATNACTPRAAALVPSGPPCQIQSVRWTTRVNLFHHFIYLLCPYLCLGMPFLMGCCCVGLCGARNLVRYQYRIGGDECFDDFCFPAMISGAASCLASCGIICLPCVLGFFSYFVAVIMKILKESEVQLKARGGVPGFYLSSPPASEMNKNINNEVMSPVYINSHGVVATPTTAVSVPHNQEPTVVAVEFSNSGSKNM